MKTYSELVDEVAKDIFEDKKDELKEVIIANNELSADNIYDDKIYQEMDLSDIIYEWIYSSWYGILRDECFKDFNSELTTCARIIELSKETETDTGLWEGLEPTKAIEAQAFFSFRNDVYFAVEELIKDFIQELTNKDG